MLLFRSFHATMLLSVAFAFNIYTAEIGQAETSLTRSKNVSAHQIAAESKLTASGITKEVPASDKGDEIVPYIMYQQAVYNDQTHHEELAAFGFEHIPLWNGWYFFPPGHDREDVDDAVRERLIHNVETRMEDGKSYVLDIEHWPTHRAVSSEVRAESVRKLIEIIDIIKSIRPSVIVGYYSMAPQASYSFTATFENCIAAGTSEKECRIREEEWHAANTEVLPLVEKADFLAPSVYTVFDDPEGWVHFARAYLGETKRLADLAGGKPIYAYVWPRYHGNNPDGLGYSVIDGALFRYQLETIKQTGFTNGMILWDNSEWVTFDYVMHNEDWFKQMVDFIDRLDDGGNPNLRGANR